MRPLPFPITCLLFMLAPPVASAGQPPPLSTDQARESYSVGYRAITDLQQKGREPDLAALLRGALDALSGTPQIGPEEMRALLKEPAQVRSAGGVRDELTPISAAEAFLAANAVKPGVKTLPSGLQYRVLHAGSGRTPRASDRVLVHYRASRLDGTELDNTFTDDSPETYRVDEVMPGWTEALQLMPEGAEWELYIPSRLAYGKRGPLENQTLIYRLKLLSVIAQEPETDGTEPAASQ